MVTIVCANGDPIAAVVRGVDGMLSTAGHHSFSTVAPPTLRSLVRHGQYRGPWYLWVTFPIVILDAQEVELAPKSWNLLVQSPPQSLSINVH